MRIFPDWIKTTLKEDKDFYRCIIDALDCHPNKEQVEVLSLVKFHHLDNNRDLRNELFGQFSNVLDELAVDEPDVSVNVRNKEAGSWWPIPKHGTTHNGQSHNERMAHRASKRLKMWSALVEASGYPVGEIDAMLAHTDTQVGQLRDRLFDVLNNEIKRLEQKHDEMLEIMADLSEANCDMQNRLRSLETRMLQSHR